MTAVDEPLLVLAGPTAAGKTHFALLLAERHGFEIISADSRQVYRGLDIGTAKPAPEEQARVRHHVIDVCDPQDLYDAARFVADAEAAIVSVRARGRRPLVAGGTGMYIRSLTEGLFEGGGRDAGVRARLTAEASAVGAPALHRRLTERDPEAAARIQPNDAVRIVRALEVIEVTGRTLSELHRRSRRDGPRHPRRLAVIDPGRDELHRRIAERTAAMFAAGLIDEVRALLARGVERDAPGMRAIGYPQAIAVLDGALTPAEAAAQIAHETRRYAKRQRTWFRSEHGAAWIDGAQRGEKILDAIRKTLAIV